MSCYSCCYIDRCNVGDGVDHHRSSHCPLDDRTCAHGTALMAWCVDCDDMLNQALER